MGNNLSLSSIVEKLYAVEPEARSTALDNLCEEHPEIKSFLRNKYQENPLPLPHPKPSRPSHLQLLSIIEPVPDEQKLSDKYAPWSKDITSFWTSASSTFIPEETSCKPLLFIYNATIRQQTENHESCLRGRYVALFWFDYFTKRYPEKRTGFDQDYRDLGREIGGVETNAEDLIIPTLRNEVKAGRRYNKLTEKFGDGILLILPSSIGRSTLEQKLPLGDTFEAFVSPLVGSGWEKCARTEFIKSLGGRIRQSLLEICLRQQDSPHKSTKRKAHPAQSSRKSKKQNVPPVNTTVRSKTSSMPTNSAPTPRILEQVYHLEEPEIVRTTDANIAVRPQDTYCDRDPGTAAFTGATDCGSSGHAMNDPETQDQDIEGAPQSAHNVLNQRATEERGDMFLPHRTETTPKTGERIGVQCEDDPMLSYLSAEDWGTCDIRTFIPTHFEPDPFMPVPFESDPLLGVPDVSSEAWDTSSSPF